MCIICIEFEKNRLTVREAKRNLIEIGAELDDEHVKEVIELLNSAEAETINETVED